ncbi:hypothetical protein BZA05DRAFT_384639 [Tricharina praecox]|uniref:uncharacterized protein n=1 Tax=Tricharina praecox TaxID=43433 RepID=UPI00221F6322|nr:uncharacterized protein BZA05DRAFT_384639 [Tricharina praecox]KAI5857733.1 hypothetical protein BZA05DRAFT_384639 [Tricharina praecox]
MVFGCGVKRWGLLRAVLLGVFFFLLFFFAFSFSFSPLILGNFLLRFVLPAYLPGPVEVGTIHDHYYTTYIHLSTYQN